MFCLLVENVPAELRDPFYCDQYEQEHLKPPVTRLLQSSELYCRTYSLLLGGAGAEAQPKDNVALMQLLTQRGIVSKDQDTPVTDADLRHKPIKMVMLWFDYGNSKHIDDGTTPVCHAILWVVACMDWFEEMSYLLFG